MSKKKTVILIAGALVLGIAIGVVGTLGISGRNNQTGAIRNVITYYDYPEIPEAPELHRSCDKVDEFDERLNYLLDDLWDTLQACGAQGVGLSAPQVGVYKQVCVIANGADKIELINPVVEESSGESEGVEGCLSFPTHFTIVTRPEKIRVKYQDRTGETQYLEKEGFMARAILHEIDHLNGRLYLDGKAE